MIPPGPGFVGLLRERARRSPARGFQRLQAPLGAARKPTAPLGVSHGEAGKPTALPGLLRGEARKPTTAVAFARPGAFPAARPAGTARFLITRGKASFYETATFGRRKVFFCSPFCGLLFCPARAKLALPAGEKPAAPKPRPPRGGPPNDRDRLPVFAPPARTPAPATRPSPPAREGPLGAPNDRTFPPGAERKARKEKGKEEPRMKRAPPL